MMPGAGTNPTIKSYSASIWRRFKNWLKLIEPHAIGDPACKYHQFNSDDLRSALNVKFAKLARIPRFCISHFVDSVPIPSIRRDPNFPFAWHPLRSLDG